MAPDKNQELLDSMALLREQIHKLTDLLNALNASFDTPAAPSQDRHPIMVMRDLRGRQDPQTKGFGNGGGWKTK